MRQFTSIFIFIAVFLQTKAQQETGSLHNFAIESSAHIGYIVRNSGEVPTNKAPFLLTINPSIQTDGSDDWHQIYGFPRAGLKFTLGSLGNNKELGYIVGFTPNITFKTSARHWYMPSVNLGLGVAWFNKKYDVLENPKDYYIGSHLTALAEASIQFEPKLSDKTFLLTGIRVIHCSNSHYQVPNLGLNLISFYMGVLINPSASVEKPYKTLNIPKSGIHLNIRSGIGIHELSRTMGPAGSPKFTIYANDIYLSKRYGKVSNVQLGLEVNYYKSYYNYIVTNNFFDSQRRLKSTVFTAFLAHELMIKRFSLVTQGGINLYNKFYTAYINQYKSEQGVSLVLKKLISSRLGLQYYLFDPKYNTRSNVFVGAYIKANFSEADFFCVQAGFVL